MPSGNGDTPVETTVGGTLVSKVTLATDCPAAFSAVTVSAPLEGITDGAVYRPADVITPATAVQLVAPADLNCCVAPRIRLIDAGDIAAGGTLVTNVMLAEEEPAVLQI